MRPSATASFCPIYLQLGFFLSAFFVLLRTGDQTAAGQRRVEQNQVISYDNLVVFVCLTLNFSVRWMRTSPCTVPPYGWRDNNQFRMDDSLQMSEWIFSINCMLIGDDSIAHACVQRLRVHVLRCFGHLRTEWLCFFGIRYRSFYDVSFCCVHEYSDEEQRTKRRTRVGTKIGRWFRTQIFWIWEGDSTGKCVWSIKSTRHWYEGGATTSCRIRLDFAAYKTIQWSSDVYAYKYSCILIYWIGLCARICDKCDVNRARIGDDFYGRKKMKFMRHITLSRGCRAVWWRLQFR